MTTTDLAVPYTGVPGLEDVDQSDLSTPRLNIDHDKGVFVHSNSKEEFESLTVVVLGLVKGRIMWAPVTADEKYPRCRSLDFHVGLPNPETFPYETYPGLAAASTEASCDACPNKDWNDKTPPACAEQWHLPIVMPDGSPAIFTASRTGLPATKKYIGAFTTAKLPAFSNFTTLSLHMQAKGTRAYGVPAYVKGAATDPANHPEYVTTFYGARNFLQTVRVREEDSAPKAPAPKTAPVIDAEAEEEEPF